MLYQVRVKQAEKRAYWYAGSVLLLVFISVIGCELTAPERPPSVPDAAVWAGGIGGGDWIEGSVDKKDNVNICTVYNAHTGDVEVSGTFRLRDYYRAASEEELQFVFYDGEVIQLKNDLILEPIKVECKYPRDEG
jgi:hypothetical protein